MGGNKMRKGSRRRWRGTLLVTIALAVASSGCEEFLLSASNLDIGPNPAEPGELMVATVLVSMLPTQPHTIFFFVDGEEYLRVSSDDAPQIPVILDLGDAADMIAEFGVGVHSAHVVVRMDDQGESARTEAVIFELVEGES